MVLRGGCSISKEAMIFVLLLLRHSECWSVSSHFPSCASCLPLKRNTPIVMPPKLSFPSKVIGHQGATFFLVELVPGKVSGNRLRVDDARCSVEHRASKLPKGCKSTARFATTGCAENGCRAKNRWLQRRFLNSRWNTSDQSWLTRRSGNNDRYCGTTTRHNINTDNF